MLSVFVTLAITAAVANPPRSAGTIPKPDQVVDVIATDYRFEMPHSFVAGPTLFRLVNRGRELHHLYIVRLADGKHAADFVAALEKGGPPPAWATDMGGPNGVDPGSTSPVVTVLLTPGNYAALCIIPSADHAPHVAKGMSADFTVSSGARAASFPKAPEVTVDLTDYGFAFSKPLTTGAHEVLVRNIGKQSHELELARLAPGKNPGDITAWIDNMSGPPPATFLGGVSPLAPGRENELALTLTPGHYVMLCFVPDANDGKPHTMHGMVHDFVVR
jgi:uncharacterized cupredoxin-like copper-binding protein